MAETKNKKRKLVNAESEEENERKEPEVSQKLKKIKVSGKYSKTHRAAPSNFSMILKSNDIKFEHWKFYR